jgi:Fic family protein
VNVFGIRLAEVHNQSNAECSSIRRSIVPPSADTVSDVVPVLFEKLREENEPAAGAVLGHFVFVYIHPSIDRKRENWKVSYEMR